MLAFPAAPPLAQTDWRAVDAWVQTAAAGLATRREGLKLVRQIERVLAEQSRTARQIGCAQERVEQRLALAKERAAGTHWKRRDAGRRAKQPTHVDVDPVAWRRVKSLAARRGVGLGAFVGQLVNGAAVLPPIPQDTDQSVQTVRLFARVAVSTEHWSAFAASAQEAGSTVPRAVGLVVEAAAKEVS